MNYETLDFTELEQRYATVEKYIEQIGRGTLRSIVISGPAGVGKTYSVEQYLKKYCQSKHTVINGHISMLSLYGELYRHKEQGNVLVLDDIDSVFSKIEGLNILKAAMDTKRTRTINWQSTTHLLTAAKIPLQFNFNGSVVLITNEGRGSFNKKLTQHYEAICDRTFHLKVASDSQESCLHQINFMILKKNLLRQFEFSKETINEILDYINSNYKSISKLSLRTAFKAAQLASIDSSNWKQWAKEGLQDE